MTKHRKTKADVANDPTPSKVVDAAVACILEEGFYRASSNEIARRAEVTWGVIQYHFGTREALLLAVLERAAAELQNTLNDTVIDGATLADRVNQLADRVWGYYARPEFLAYMQVMLNLSHDPTTESETRAAMENKQNHVSKSLPKLLREVIGDLLPDDHPDKTKLSMYVFAALRGMAIDQGNVGALPTARPNPGGHAEDRAMLQASVVTYVESVIAKEKGRGLLSSRRR
ncbi:MAG: TetR/AcrR family transcriptional regulator [Acidimicrobiales bacterium]|nr:TetR/AcrR family transcriptional regulator [Acidimicrobiales bacterium]